MLRSHGATTSTAFRVEGVCPGPGGNCERARPSRWGSRRRGRKIQGKWASVSQRRRGPRTAPPLPPALSHRATMPVGLTLESRREFPHPPRRVDPGAEGSWVSTGTRTRCGRSWVKTGPRTSAGAGRASPTTRRQRGSVNQRGQASERPTDYRPVSTLFDLGASGPSGVASAALVGDIRLSRAKVHRHHVTRGRWFLSLDEVRRVIENPLTRRWRSIPKPRTHRWPASCAARLSIRRAPRGVRRSGRDSASGTWTRPPSLVCQRRPGGSSVSRCDC